MLIEISLGGGIFLNIKKIILKQIIKEIPIKDKIKVYILKTYTFRIYKMGYKNGFNLRRKSK